MSIAKPSRPCVVIALAALLGACDPDAPPVNDTEPPAASIVFPHLDQTWVRSSEVVVRGVASDDTEVASVTVNGVEATSSDGFATWQARVELAPGQATEPDRIAFDPVNDRIVVTNLSLVGAQNLLAYIDASTGDREFRPITGMSGQPQALVFDPATGLLYLVDMGTNSVLALDYESRARRGPRWSSAPGLRRGLRRRQHRIGRRLQG